MEKEIICLIIIALYVKFIKNWVFMFENLIKCEGQKPKPEVKDNYSLEELAN